MAKKNLNSEAAPVERDILGCMERIVRASKYELKKESRYSRGIHYEYDDALMKTVEADAAYLAEQYHITPKQAVLFTIILEMAKDDDVSKSALSDSLKCNFVQLLAIEMEIKELEQSFLVKRSYGGNVIVADEVYECLLNNKPYIKPDYKNLSTRNILSKMKRLFKSMEDDEGRRELYLNQMDDMILSNPETCIAKVADKYHILASNGILIEGIEENKDLDISFKLRDYEGSMRPCERLLFYALCYRYDEHDDDSCGWWDFRHFFDDNQMEYLEDKYKMQMLDLQKGKVVEYASSEGFKVKDQFKIADSVKEELFADCGGLHMSAPVAGTLRSEDLIYKPLFYDDDVARQVDALSKLMSQERYEQIRSALTKSGMRTGFSCLFYGSPGTGKTETVYQLAKNTGRDIIMADVSKLKSMWVGESEKNLKALFANYRKAVRETKVTPILLFNEADAIFGLRRSGAESAVDKMENSLQNIILQEMEDLQGILIATTNLSENLDKAFERRFLYKIKFTKPSQAVKCLIWRSMMPNLTEADALLLSTKFEFSGGQIENIVRKKTIQSILSGSDLDVNDIIHFCWEEEINSKNGTKIIGF